MCEESESWLMKSESHAGKEAGHSWPYDWQVLNEKKQLRWRRGPPVGVSRADTVVANRTCLFLSWPDLLNLNSVGPGPHDL